jgi:hypothetical protein
VQVCVWVGLEILWITLDSTPRSASLRAGGVGGGYRLTPIAFRISRATKCDTFVKFGVQIDPYRKLHA